MQYIYITPKSTDESRRITAPEPVWGGSWTDGIKEVQSPLSMGDSWWMRKERGLWGIFTDVADWVDGRASMCRLSIPKVSLTGQLQKRIRDIGIDRDFALLTTATWSCRAPTLADSVGAVFLCPGRTSGTSYHLTFGKCPINQIEEWKLFKFQTALTNTSEDNIKRRAIAKTSTSTSTTDSLQIHQETSACMVYVRSYSSKQSNNFDERPNRHLATYRGDDWVRPTLTPSNNAFLGPTRMEPQTASRSV